MKRKKLFARFCKYVPAHQADDVLELRQAVRDFLETEDRDTDELTVSILVVQFMLKFKRRYKG